MLMLRVCGAYAMRPRYKELTCLSFIVDSSYVYFSRAFRV